MRKTDVRNRIMNPRWRDLGGYLYEFDSVLEQAEYAVALAERAGQSSALLRAERVMIRDGDSSLIAEAEALMERVNAQVEVLNPVWVNDQFGSVPDVPGFIAGHPDCMRRKIHEFADRGPIRVFLSTACSAAVDEDAVHKRGIATLAMVMLLKEYRPVELYLFSESTIPKDGMRLRLQTAKVDLDNIDLSSFCYSVCSVDRYRTVDFAISRESTSGFYYAESEIYWGWDYSGWNQIADPKSEYRQNIRSCLGAGELDIVMNPIVWATDELQTLVDDPVQWVQNQIDEHATNLREEECLI